MQDANASRFALLLGPRDWGACELETRGALPTGSLHQVVATFDSGPSPNVIAV